jgi:hypothetical protein
MKDEENQMTPQPAPAPTHFDWAAFLLKVKLTLVSRKFWIFASSTAAIWFAYSAGGMTLALTVQAQIAAGAAYAVSVALEDGLSAGKAT